MTGNGKIENPQKTKTQKPDLNFELSEIFFLDELYKYWQCKHKNNFH